MFWVTRQYRIRFGVRIRWSHARSGEERNAVRRTSRACCNCPQKFLGSSSGSSHRCLTYSRRLRVSSMRGIVALVMVGCGAAYPGQEMGKGFIPPTSPVPMLNDSVLDLVSTPEAIDWSEKGVTTKIKNQGSCGCCWAFAVAEGIESAAKMAHGHLEELSAGQICRCDTRDGGCNGGNPSTAFDYFKSKGFSSHANDPYGDQVHHGTTEHCKWNKHMAATIAGYKQVHRREHSLAAALAHYAL